LYGGYQDFKEQVASLLGQPDLTAEMGRKGKEFVSQTYNWQKVMRVYNQVLEKLSAQIAREQA
jgi:uncharacterized protein YukE